MARRTVRPLGSIVLPFKIKKAFLALRIESLLENIFSIGINWHVLGDVVGRGEEMFCDCSRFGFGVSVIVHGCLLRNSHGYNFAENSRAKVFLSFQSSSHAIEALPATSDGC